MTHHNTSCQHKITVCILVHGSGGDALMMGKSSLQWSLLTVINMVSNLQQCHAFCIIQHARLIAVFYLFCFVTLCFAQVDHLFTGHWGCDAMPPPQYLPLSPSILVIVVCLPLPAKWILTAYNLFPIFTADLCHAYRHLMLANDRWSQQHCTGDFVLFYTMLPGILPPISYTSFGDSQQVDRLIFFQHFPIGVVCHPAQGTLLLGWLFLFHRFIVVSLFSFHCHTGRFIVVWLLLRCPCLFIYWPSIHF